MKPISLAGLLVALAASSFPVHAGDNPDQAAARAALVKKLFELTTPQAQPPRWDSGAVVVRPDQPTNQPSEPVVNKSEPPQTTPAATNLPAPPVKEAPAAITPAVAATPVPAPIKAPTPVLLPAITKPSPPPVAVKVPKPALKWPPANDFVTTTGTIYKEARVEKVEPDGVIISYVPARGGIAMTKVSFEDLPSYLRQQYERKKK